ncbi:hypothetical protein EJ110_NYTH20147 [Nymphaea thermarum]|nr:hypothetical protein EJ110_NYTH20147 [Nymphaea thermarum]
MKHFVKIIALLVAASAVWIGLLKSSIVSGSIWLLPVYFVISLGCYGLLMVGVGLMVFPTCPHEAVLLQKVSSHPYNCGRHGYIGFQLTGSWEVYCKSMSALHKRVFCQQLKYRLVSLLVGQSGCSDLL